MCVCVCVVYPSIVRYRDTVCAHTKYKKARAGKRGSRGAGERGAGGGAPCPYIYRYFSEQFHSAKGLERFSHSFTTARCTNSTLPPLAQTPLSHYPIPHATTTQTRGRARGAHTHTHTSLRSTRRSLAGAASAPPRRCAYYPLAVRGRAFLYTLYHHTDTIARARQPACKLLLLFGRERLHPGRHLV